MPWCWSLLSVPSTPGLFPSPCLLITLSQRRLQAAPSQQLPSFCHLCHDFSISHEAVGHSECGCLYYPQEQLWFGGTGPTSRPGWGQVAPRHCVMIPTTTQSSADPATSCSTDSRQKLGAISAKGDLELPPGSLKNRGVIMVLRTLPPCGGF